MTLPRRSLLRAVTATVFVPAAVLAARFPNGGVIERSTLGTSLDSGFTRPGITSAKTPKACRAALDSATEQAYTSLDSALKKLSSDAKESVADSAYNAISVAKKAAAVTCAQQFKAEDADSTQLPVLIELYQSAGMDDALHAALDRRIAMATTDKQKMDALMGAVRAFATADTTPERTAMAEPYVAALDMMGDSARGMRIQAHAHIADIRAYYQSDDPLAKSHAQQALDLARTIVPEMNTDTSEKLKDDYGSGIVAGADGYAAAGDYKGALAILNEGISTLGDTCKSHSVPEMLKSFRRYALIGTPAPAVLAEHWLNAPEGTTTLPYAGHVTMVEFTTTWCGWCKKGYPAMRRLAAKYADRGYQPMFVSLIEGAAMGKPDTVAAEVSYDQDHWVQHDSIGFPIAIYDTKAIVFHPKRDTAALAKAAKDSASDSVKKKPAPPPPPAWHESPTLFKEYLVDGYPTYYFVDKKGIIRDVQVGHSADLEARFSAIIERLLAEPDVASSEGEGR